MPLAFLYSPELKEYDFGPGHPFRGDRFQNFPTYLEKVLPPDDNYIFLTASAATDEDLLKICQKEYIEFTRLYFAAAHEGRDYDGDFYLYHSPDNMPSGRPGDLEFAARVIVGQAKRAADLVQSGQFPKVVSIGGGLHHAGPSYGQGFCLYNDVAFCVAYLRDEHKLDRIVVLDTDAHAGNGTSAYFYDSAEVLFIDLHQDPRTLYPGTGLAHDIGDGPGKGYTINVPLPPYAGNQSYAEVFDQIIEPVVMEYRPQIIVRNGGSDPYFEDGLTRLGLTAAGFRMIGDRVRRLSEVCGGKEIDLITSGYNPQTLPDLWFALLSGIAGYDVPFTEPLPVPERLKSDLVLDQTRQVIEQVKDAARPYWRCFR